jgi:hypothetical protein
VVFYEIKVIIIFSASSFESFSSSGLREILVLEELKILSELADSENLSKN